MQFHKNVQKYINCGFQKNNGVCWFFCFYLITPGSNEMHGETFCNTKKTIITSSKRIFFLVFFNFRMMLLRMNVKYIFKEYLNLSNVQTVLWFIKIYTISCKLETNLSRKKTNTLIFSTLTLLIICRYPMSGFRELPIWIFLKRLFFIQYVWP